MLRIKNLTCGYNSKSVLHDMTFPVASGEFLGIIGPNGSGKTTLLRAITRVIRLKEGEIIFEQRNIRQMGFKELAREIAVVLQSSYAGYMSVGEFVLLGRIPYYKKFQLLETKEDEEIAQKYMALTDTLRLRAQPMEKISGGEKQLALLARALCQEPKLLLLDEPTAHLDITHQASILDLIKRLNKELGLTVIMVLHDLNLAGEYCDRLLLINQGRIHSMGTPKEVLTYQNLEEVYRTVLVVKENPVSLRPHIFVVSEEARKKRTDKKNH